MGASYIRLAREFSMNVNPEEISKFDELAARWWDTEGEFKPLHDLNPVRLDYVQRYCELKGAQVLDVGCGGGILSESLAASGASVTGLDASERALGIARLHLHESPGIDVEYVQSTAEQWAEDHQAHYDVITCMEMLEHVPDPSQVLQACSSMLRDGGTLVVSTINRTPKAFAMAIVGAEYVLNLLPRGTHEYASFIRPSVMAGWARAASLSLVSVDGMHYQPLNRQASLTQDVSVNYLACFRRSE